MKNEYPNCHQTNTSTLRFNAAQIQRRISIQNGQRIGESDVRAIVTGQNQSLLSTEKFAFSIGFFFFAEVTTKSTATLVVTGCGLELC